MDESPKVTQARSNVRADLGEHFGKAVFIRIFKENNTLELWVRNPNEQWHCLRTYKIAAMSGTLGPKTQEGDKQAPEGFYRVLPKSLNPYSKYHLSFNIGYPNNYDIALGRTGSYIMIHGGNDSAGCFALTDEKIEEIYTLVHEAFKADVKSVPVQIYPFRMTEARMMKERHNEHEEFWQHLVDGYRYTESFAAPYPDEDSQ